MKNIIAVLIVLGFFTGTAQALEKEDLVGHWHFYKKIYKGMEMPEPPEATLRLEFEFTADGMNHLYWTHQGDTDICERRGNYFVKDDYLVDEIVWVNPKNSSDCAKDPDMQRGKRTITPISIKNKDLYLYMMLGDDPLIYIWKKIEN